MSETIKTLTTLAESLKLSLATWREDNNSADDRIFIQLSMTDGELFGEQISPDDKPAIVVQKVLAFINEVAKMQPPPSKTGELEAKLAELEARATLCGCEVRPGGLDFGQEMLDYVRHDRCFRVGNALYPENHSHYKRYRFRKATELDKLEQAIDHDTLIFADAYAGK